MTDARPVCYKRRKGRLAKWYSTPLFPPQKRRLLCVYIYNWSIFGKEDTSSSWVQKQKQKQISYSRTIAFTIYIRKRERERERRPGPRGSKFWGERWRCQQERNRSRQRRVRVRTGSSNPDPTPNTSSGSLLEVEVMIGCGRDQGIRLLSPSPLLRWGVHRIGRPEMRRLIEREKKEEATTETLLFASFFRLLQIYRGANIINHLQDWEYVLFCPQISGEFGATFLNWAFWKSCD